MKLFSGPLLFVYHCFSRPEQVVHFCRRIIRVPIVNKEVFTQRTNDYQNWVEA